MPSKRAARNAIPGSRVASANRWFLTRSALPIDSVSSEK
jgi:hypothetical protein